MTTKILKSEEDPSVNFITPCKDGGYFESRYVRRREDYFICYLSSQSGCNRGCKFCHLTTTKQTMMTDADYLKFISQALEVYKHYDKEVKAKVVHYNWMARGEPLCNKTITKINRYLFDTLTGLAEERELIPRFNISTIMPKTMDTSLAQMFKGYNPTIYYSLYSVDPKFREKWLPGAMPVEDALKQLKEYQDITGKFIKLHWAFIEGENSELSDLHSIFDMVEDYHLLCEFNLVRYNPYSEIEGKEPSEEKLAELLNYIKVRLRGRSQMVTRVGRDIFCSCGCFYSDP